MEHGQKATLPSTELGDSRCFQIEYFGHGDIFMVAWEGSIDFEPSADDSTSACFGFSHGSDVTILAALGGYLRRIGHTVDETRDVLLEAGTDVLTANYPEYQLDRSRHNSLLGKVAVGQEFRNYDLDGITGFEHSLSCLLPPVPDRPGQIGKTGGTGIYTTPSQADQEHLVFVSLAPNTALPHEENLTVSHTAEFCEQDVQTIAKLVCDVALGEYRIDVYAFLKNFGMGSEEA
ncbi:MAG: hypothetical protein U5K77_01675 [Candidatus Saccharibacteria bacterium]|nr:hypothetical protein [Candidatus Saccharibacteria bacterium]